VNQAGNYISRFFGVIARSSTYLNLLYLLLAFPLGLFYFIFLIVGFSLGFSLLILLVGIFILLIVFAGWIAFAAFERKLAIWLLREEIPPMTPPRLRNRPAESTVSWNGFIAYLSSPATWTSLVYLFAKFPLGIISFVALVGAAALTGVFLTAPLTYQLIQPQVWFTWNSVWVIDTIGDALLALLIGIPLLFISLHVLNGLAWVSGKIARLMLGTAGEIQERPGTPAALEAAPKPVEEQEVEFVPEAEPADEPEVPTQIEEAAPERSRNAEYEVRPMQTHVKVLGWLYIVLGVLGLLLAFVVFVAVFGGGLISGDEQAIAITALVATIVGGILFLVSAPGIIAGLGLLGYRNWARILALILGIINLPGFPVGTVLGAYTLYVLLQDETSTLFAA
jgi:hypothetical protein